MLLPKWGGFQSLPSRYGGVGGSFQHSSVQARGSELPSQEAAKIRGKPMSSSQSLSAAGLEKIGGDKVLPSKIPFPSQLETNGMTAAPELSSPRSTPRGTSMNFLCPGPLPRARSVSFQPGTQGNDHRTDVTRGMEYSMQSPRSSLRRRNSLSHLPTYNTKDFNSDQPLARTTWNGSQLDLQATFLEEAQRNMKFGEAGGLLAGQPKEFGERNLELEVDMIEFELSSLKQKQMESSFVHLEKEKKWLEVIRSEGQKRKGVLDDKIFKVEMELAKAKSYFGKRDHHLLSPGFRQKGNVIQEKLDVGHELRNLQESLAALKNCIKALEEKRDEMVQQLKCVKEGEPGTPSHQAATNSPETKQARSQRKAAEKDIKRENVVLHQQVQHLSLELEHAQQKQEECSDQILALKSELASSKTQINQQEQEKVLMKEEMESVRQLNEELSSKVAESHRRLHALLEKLRLLEEEKKFHANHIQALEDERTQLLEEKEQHLLRRASEQQGQEEAMKTLQGSCENLRESQIQWQKEKDLLQAHCLELERRAEELGKRLGEQQSVSQQWKNRWEQVDATLKTKEEALEKMSAQSQVLQAKQAEAPLLLQIQLEACKQELELGQNRRQALHHQVQALQAGSQNSAKMFPKEADPDMPVVQEELQKAWDLLKTHEMVLEEQQMKLESARIQNTECSLEKQRLEQLVRALEEQLAEKKQVLRDLRQAKDVDRAGLEMRTSSSELKITREDVGVCYEKGRPGGLDAKVIGNPLRGLEGLRLQHHFVTEQLKDLFRQRQQQQTGAREHHDGGLKEKSPGASQNVPGPLTTANEPLGLPEESHSEFGGAPRSEEAAQSLQQQLKAKTEMISAMACEIQALKEKNENLMKAKLRFQQQIQQIRQLPKRRPEKSQSHRELWVPRLSISPREDLQSAHCSEILGFSPPGDEAPFSPHSSRETQHAAVQEQCLPACPEDEQSGPSSSPRMVRMGPTPLPSVAPHQPHESLSDTSSPSNKLLLAPVASPKGPPSHTEGEGALLSHCSSGLLSPKPFGAPRPWSPFRESAESPENRREL